MAVPDTKPAGFTLPDGRVELITWAYVLYKLDEPLTAIKNLIDSENTSLAAIEAKLETWVEEQ